jgi:hypothetical protein
MLIATRGETVDIHIGALFVQMIQPHVQKRRWPMGCFEVVSEPETIIQSSGSHAYRWYAKDIETGEIIRFSVSNTDLFHTPALYSFETEHVKESLRSKAWRHRPFFEALSVIDPEFAEEWRKEQERLKMASDKESKLVSLDEKEKEEKPSLEKKVPRLKWKRYDYQMTDSYIGIGCGMILTVEDNSISLINTKTWKERLLVSTDRKVLVDDSEIDLDAIHKRFKHRYCVDNKMACYRFREYSDFENGVCALSWMIHPDGSYLTDEDEEDTEYNAEEENVYCIINTNLEIIVPFRPMENVHEVLNAYKHIS